MTSLRLMASEPGSGITSEWQKLIWEANKIEAGFFGRPSFLGPWWAGGSVEEYEHARVIHRNDSPTVSIVSKTEHGAEVLTLAAAALAALTGGA